jgi:imidazolonepropionase-like amidohydrolase
MLFLRAMALGALLLLAACSSTSSDPPKPPPKVIVGGTLIDGTGRPPIVNSVVIIDEGKIMVATSANGIELPADAVRTNATGLFVTPSQLGGRLEFGAPADLYLLQGNPLDNPLLLGNPMRVMKTGEWLDANKQ